MYGIGSLVILLSAGLLLQPPAVVAADGRDGEFLYDFLAGRYQMVGKGPESTVTYAGRVTLARGDSGLVVTREIGGRSATGSARVETAAKTSRCCGYVSPRRGSNTRRPASSAPISTTTPASPAISTAPACAPTHPGWKRSSSNIDSGARGVVHLCGFPDRQGEKMKESLRPGIEYERFVIDGRRFGERLARKAGGGGGA